MSRSARLGSRRGAASLLILAATLSAIAGEPAPKPPDELARYDARIKPADRKHWAYQPVRPAAVPDVKDAAWCRNPIDRFLLARMEEKGFRPAPVAAPLVLLRRVYLDLTGLPPTPAEQDEFLKDPSPEAFERVADRLLASPAYGERWGRHWLDLVRYAETNGYERDAAKPHVWRYRDYVIDSINKDKPFDRFALEQLAGDELPDVSTETVLALGYYRLGPWDDEPADPAEDRFDQLDDIVNTTAQAFLGLTLGCARCHNHKFEALTALDYYRMVAIFNTLQRPRNGRTELDLPAGPRKQVLAVQQRDRTVLALGMVLVGQRPLNALVSAAVVVSPARRFRETTPDLPRGYFLHEPSPKPPMTHLLARGQASRPGPVVGPGVPAVLVSSQPAFPPPGEHTSRRRLTLAKWIASPDNPLTARVIVNRVWQFHFGEGLVRTPSDFGVMGEKPTHPELLDWLARWFVDHGWSLKQLHRLILTSSAYRMSKRADAGQLARDPEGRLWWRFPYRRLEVEAVRDSMLAASGQLNRRMHGPSMFPHIPKEALEGSSDPDKVWKESAEREASRRTVYAHVKRSMVVPLLEVLDVCDTTKSTAKRNVTSVAPQALTLLNGEFTTRQARHFADRLRREAGADEVRQIELAYRLALCRPPTPAERERMARFLQKEAEGQAAEAEKAGRPIGADEAQRRALAQLCRVIFNLNEFVYTD